MLLTNSSPWLLIPAKATRLAKRRLSPVLSPDQRANLCAWFLENTLARVEASGISIKTLVLTSDPLLEAIAARFSAPTLPDPPGADLNAVLENGRAHALAHGAASLLVLPTDLPYLTGDALAALLDRAGGISPSVLIAPDREGSGTNALMLRPADAIPFGFGAGSATLHHAEAQSRGIPIHELHDPAFACDIDTPEQYLDFRQSLSTVGGKG